MPDSRHAVALGRNRRRAAHASADAGVPLVGASASSDATRARGNAPHACETRVAPASRWPAALRPSPDRLSAEHDDDHGLDPDRRARRGADRPDAAAGRLYGTGLPGRAGGADGGSRSGRAVRLSAVARRRRRGAGLEDVRVLAADLQRGELAGALPRAAYAGDPPAEPPGVHAFGPMGPVVQYCVVVRIEHQLAVL